MPTRHVVQKGEYLSKIAAGYGYSDWKAIWNAPENGALREKRKSPNVLYEGDVIIVPDQVPGAVTVQTGRSHRFVLRRGELYLRLQLADVDGTPLQNLPCMLEVEGERFSLTTDGDGKIEQRISSTAEHGRLVYGDREVELRIGHLDPVEEVSGAQARLNNLGYDAGTPETADDPQFRSAVEEFQCEHKVPVTGLLDTATMAKLRTVHGQ